MMLQACKRLRHAAVVRIKFDDTLSPRLPQREVVDVMRTAMRLLQVAY